MILKSYKDDQFELLLQHDDINQYYSVTLLKNNKQAEFQGKLDFDTAMQVYDYYWDKMSGADLTVWNGVVE